MNSLGDFSVKAHMPRACEAQRAETKLEKKSGDTQ